MSEIYINNTLSISGGKNGELYIELDDEEKTLLVWNARSLYNDLPGIIAMTHIEIEEEQKLDKKKWTALGNQIIKDYRKK